MKKVVVALSLVALLFTVTGFYKYVPDDLVVGIYQEDKVCNMEVKDEVELQRGEFMLQVNVSKEIKDAKVYIQASYSDTYFDKDIRATDLVISETVKCNKYFKRRKTSALLVDTEKAIEIIDYKAQKGLFYRINDVQYYAQQKNIENVVDVEGNEISLSAVDKDIYLLVIVEGKKGNSTSVQEISRKKVQLKWK